MKKRQIIIVASLVGVIAIVGAVQSFSSDDEGNSENTSENLAVEKVGVTQESSTRSFQTLRVENKDLPFAIALTGRVEAESAIDLYAEVQGKMLPSYKPFKEGISYNKGQVLLKIDDEEARYNLQSQKSRFLNAIVRMMSDLKFDYPEAHKKWSAYLENYDNNDPLVELPATDNPQVKYFLASRNIYDQYYSIKGLESRLDKYTIRAPFNGALKQANVDPGMLVNPQMMLGKFIRTDLFQVTAAVSLSDLKYIEIGDQLNLRSRDATGQWKAVVSRIGKAVDSNTQSVKVFLRVQGNDLKDGMYLEGEINGSTIEKAIKISSNLMTRNNQVYTIQENVVKLESVIPVRYEQDQIIVKGLEDGQLMINEPVNQPIEGTRASAK